MIDSFFMIIIFDVWGMGECFILLFINKWDNDYCKVNVGGLSCDNVDYYNLEIYES